MEFYIRNGEIFQYRQATKIIFKKKNIFNNIKKNNAIYYRRKNKKQNTGVIKQLNNEKTVFNKTQNINNNTTDGLWFILFLLNNYFDYLVINEYSLFYKLYMSVSPKDRNNLFNNLSDFIKEKISSYTVFLMFKNLFSLKNPNYNNQSYNSLINSLNEERIFKEIDFKNINSNRVWGFEYYNYIPSNNPFYNLKQKLIKFFMKKGIMEDKEGEYFKFFIRYESKDILDFIINNEKLSIYFNPKEDPLNEIIHAIEFHLSTNYDYLDDNRIIKTLEIYKNKNFLPLITIRTKIIYIIKIMMLYFGKLNSKDSFMNNFGFYEGTENNFFNSINILLKSLDLNETKNWILKKETSDSLFFNDFYSTNVKHYHAYQDILYFQFQICYEKLYEKINTLCF